MIDKSDTEEDKLMTDCINGIEDKLHRIDTMNNQLSVVDINSKL